VAAVVEVAVVTPTLVTVVATALLVTVAVVQYAHGGKQRWRQGEGKNLEKK